MSNKLSWLAIVINLKRGNSLWLHMMHNILDEALPQASLVLLLLKSQHVCTTYDVGTWKSHDAQNRQVKQFYCLLGWQIQYIFNPSCLWICYSSHGGSIVLFILVFVGCSFFFFSSYKKLAKLNPNINKHWSKSTLAFWNCGIEESFFPLVSLKN